MIIESYALENIITTIFITGTITLVIVLLLMLIRWKCNINDEVFRKLMHFTAIMITPLCLYFAIDFYVAMLCLFIYAIGGAIGLRIIEKVKSYSSFFVEREKHEIRKSFVSYCSMQAVIILVCGVYGDIRIVYIELLVWAIGDMVAALCGKKWGKRHFRMPLSDHNKTYVGSIAMLIITFIISITALSIMYDFSVARIIVQSILVAVAATIAELLSHKGKDTTTIPLTVTIICLISDYIFCVIFH